MARFRASAIGGVLTIVCLIAVTACAGEDEQSTSPPASPSPAAIVTVGPSPPANPSAVVDDGPLGAYVVDVSKSGLTRLAAGEGYSVVSWTQDGTRLTLAQGESRGDEDMYEVEADGSGLTLTATVDGWVGQWSPTTRAIIRYETGRDEGQGVAQYGLYVTSTGARLGRWVADGFLGSWSPDGQWIAFVGSFCDEGRDYVGVVNVDGSGLVKLTDIVDPLQVGHAWSPDGRTLAFSAPDEQGVSQIYLADVVSGQRVKATDGPWPKMTPAWSGDGAFLSFASLEGEGPGAVSKRGLVSKDGGEATPLPDGIDYLAWSPTGRRLAYVRDGVLEALDLEKGGEPTSLALGPDETGLHWSPDGSRVAFLSQGRLYVVEVKGGATKQLTSDSFLQPGADGQETAVIDSILWSPGGTKIAFAVVRPGAPWQVCSP
jgi:Tol biopolymer transport system component